MHPTRTQIDPRPVAVVTGGNSGIGLAIARRLKSDGARIAIFGRNPDTLEAARAELSVDRADDVHVDGGLARV